MKLYQDLVELHFPNLVLARSIIAGFSQNLLTEVASVSPHEKPHAISKDLAQKHEKEFAANRYDIIPPTFCALYSSLHGTQGEKNRMCANFKERGFNEAQDPSMCGKLSLDGIPNLIQELNDFESSVVIGTEDVAAHYRQFPSAVPERAATLIHTKKGVVSDKTIGFGSSTAPNIFRSICDFEQLGPNASFSDCFLPLHGQYSIFDSKRRFALRLTNCAGFFKRTGRPNQSGGYSTWHFSQTFGFSYQHGHQTLIICFYTSNPEPIPLNLTVNATSDAFPIGGSAVFKDFFSWWVWCNCCTATSPHDMTLWELASLCMGLSSFIGVNLRSKVLI
jgi:hypothetical protein